MKTNLKITIDHSAGLHARPAALFVQTANKFSSAITVQNLTKESAVSNAKSILSVLTLGVSQGHEIEITADGEDSEEAVIALEELINGNFGEN